MDRSQIGVRPPAGLDHLIAILDPLRREKAERDPEAFDVATRRGRQITMEEAVVYVLEIAEPLM